jgi:hypothetical protein
MIGIVIRQTGDRLLLSRTSVNENIAHIVDGIAVPRDAKAKINLRCERKGLSSPTFSSGKRRKPLLATCDGLALS